MISRPVRPRGSHLKTALLLRGFPVAYLSGGKKLSEVVEIGDKSIDLAVLVSRLAYFAFYFHLFSF